MLDPENNNSLEIFEKKKGSRVKALGLKFKSIFRLKIFLNQSFQIIFVFLYDSLLESSILRAVHVIP